MDRDSGSEKMPPPPTPASGDQDSERELSKEEKTSIEKEQERKLKTKYPMMGGGGPRLGGAGGGGGHSAFLQKRLAKGQKYFDSGDYQMAKQKTKGAAAMSRVAIPVLAEPSTGDTIPTPDMVPARKTSIIQPLHDHSQSMHLASDPAHSATQAPGQPLPNPAINKLAS